MKHTNTYRKNASKRKVVSGRCKYCNKPIKGIKIKTYCDNKCKQAKKNNEKGLLPFLKQVNPGEAPSYKLYYNDSQIIIIRSEGEGAQKKWYVDITEEGRDAIIIIGHWKRLKSCKEELARFLQGKSEPLKTEEGIAIIKDNRIQVIIQE